MVAKTDEGAAAGQADPPVEGTGQPEGAAPETDWKAETEKLKEALSKAEQRAKSAEGRLRGASPEMAEIQASVKRLEREFRRKSIEEEDDPDKKSAALEALSDEERADADAERLARYMQRTAARIGVRLTKTGLSGDHPKVKEAVGKWRSVKTQDDVDAIFEEIDDWIEEEREAQRAKAEEDRIAAAEKARKEASEKAGTLALGVTGAPAAASQSAAARWSAYGRGEVPFDEATKKAGREQGFL